MSRSHLAPLDGVRAIATLSLIASHTLTIATSLFPAEGEQWERLTKHPLFIFLSGGGGVHTDMFLVIGGLLLGLQQRASWRPDAPLPSFGDVGRSVLRRAVRLWPTLLAQCVIGIGFLGEATPAAKLPLVLLCLFTLTANYLPARIGGTFSCSPSWSVCVAFHCSVAFSLLLTLIRRGLLAARVSLLALFLASFAVRAALFDAKDYSLVRLGESRHFAYFQTGQAIKYIEDRYPPFKWRAPGLDPAAFGQFGAPGSPLAAYALRYFHRLYFVTHVRFGPFALGALLGLLLPERQGSQQQQQPAAAAAAGARQGMGAVVRWLLMVQFTLMSAGTLMSTMLPPPPTPDDTPPEAHAISTIGLHNMTALSVAFLLFTVLCPETSSWHNGPLRRALSWRELRPLAKHSFALNMIHFRIILDVAFRFGRHIDPAALRCVPHVLGLYLSGTAVSFVVAVAFDRYFEAPLRSAIAMGLSAAMRAGGVQWDWRDLAGIKSGVGKKAVGGGAGGRGPAETTAGGGTPFFLATSGKRD